MVNTAASPRPTWRALVALVLTLVLVASACGDDGTLADLNSGELGDEGGDDGDDGDTGDGGDTGSDDTGSDDTGSGDTGSDDTDDMDGDGDTGSDDTGSDDTGDMDDDGDMDDGDGVDFDGSGSSTYCAFAAQQNELVEGFNPLGGPDAVEDYFTEVLALIDQAIGIGPDELRNDFMTLRDGFTQFVQILSDNDWDYLAAEDELDAFLDNPEFDAASDRIDAYDEQVCGFDDDDTFDTSDAGDDPFTSPDALAALLDTEFGRAAFAEGMAETGDITVEQGLCLIDNLDLDLLMGLAFAEGSPSAEAQVDLFEALDTCGVEASVILGTG